MWLDGSTEWHDMIWQVFEISFGMSTVQAYGNDVSQWTREELINAAGIVTGLTSAEIGTLKLHDMESISAVGNSGKWTISQVRDKLAVVFTVSDQCTDWTDFPVM